MSYVLRDYQQKASDAAVSFFNNKAKKTNAIMVLPTGSGKCSPTSRTSSWTNATLLTLKRVCTKIFLMR